MPQLPNARLSLVNYPFLTVDAVAQSTLYYTDGAGVSISLDVSGLAIGAYDVFQSGGVLTTQPFNATRNRTDYVGSINVSVAGQLTCHLSLDCNRKWEVYNAFNQRPVVLQVITQERNLTYCPTNNVANGFAPWNGNTNNCGTVFTGDPSVVEVDYLAHNFIDTLSGSFGIINSIGWDSLSFGSGVLAEGTVDDTNQANTHCTFARLIQPAAIGAHTVTMLIAAIIHSANRTCAAFSAQSASFETSLDDCGSMAIKWMG
jgi:hypothetical protein